MKCRLHIVTECGTKISVVHVHFGHSMFLMFGADIVEGTGVVPVPVAASVLSPVPVCLRALLCPWKSFLFFLGVEKCSFKYSRAIFPKHPRLTNPKLSLLVTQGFFLPGVFDCTFISHPTLRLCVFPWSNAFLLIQGYCGLWLTSMV